MQIQDAKVWYWCCWCVGNTKYSLSLCSVPFSDFLVCDVLHCIKGLIDCFLLYMCVPITFTTIYVHLSIWQCWWWQSLSATMVYKFVCVCYWIAIDSIRSGQRAVMFLCACVCELRSICMRAVYCKSLISVQWRGIDLLSYHHHYYSVTSITIDFPFLYS